ncbi:iron ABC transporter ATP-binding protein [Cellulomonas marina]|nr:iron ABC transporter ATP-binding protein [Cellulomonas marina]
MPRARTRVGAMTDVLDLQDVTVRRGATTILDGLSWQIRDGERWVVLGRNGAGKTSLLQVCSGRMHPTSGTAHLLGERLGGVDVFELRPRIGLSSAALADRIPSGETVLDVVLTASYGYTGRWRESYEEQDEARAHELLRAFGVEHLAARYFGTLSEGERKRVQIARALMSDPELLLLDEPAAGLDLGGREELVAALAELAADPRSPVIVLVTHHVEEVPPGFTHALLLRDGRAQAAGPVAEVLTADELSATFGVPLAVQRGGGRWAARALPAALTGARAAAR